MPFFSFLAVHGVFLYEISPVWVCMLVKTMLSEILIRILQESLGEGMKISENFAKKKLPRGSLRPTT